MKKIKYEYTQRIPSHYVGSDCIQIMVPQINGGITVLNSDEIIYHYRKDSTSFINKYVQDERREQFPYSNIPTHKSRFKGKTIEYINQLFDFNRVYIEIVDGLIKENYAIKDGNEALLATKFILPNKEQTRYMNRSELEKLLNSSNGGVYHQNGGYFPDLTLPSNENILNWYKDLIIKRFENEQRYGNYTNKTLTEYFYKGLDKLTIDDIPANIFRLNNIILVFVQGNEISSIKLINIKFINKDSFIVEFYDYPITIYNLDYMKHLEQTSSKRTPEPKIPKLLNPKINSENIKKEKKYILSLIETNK